MVDALASGASELRLVEVQVLSSAPTQMPGISRVFVLVTGRDERTQNLASERSEREVVERGRAQELAPSTPQRKRTKSASRLTRTALWSA